MPKIHHWVFSQDYIAYSDFEGQNKHVVLKAEHAPHAFSLSVFDDHLFWTDWHIKGIVRANKFTGNDGFVIYLVTSSCLFYVMFDC